MKWKTMNIQMLVAKPAPRPHTKNDAAESFIIERRPNRSPIRPAHTAPTAAPRTNDAAAKPKSPHRGHRRATNSGPECGPRGARVDGQIFVRSRRPTPEDAATTH